MKLSETFQEKKTMILKKNLNVKYGSSW
jgi:hypothetical protein